MDKLHDVAIESAKKNHHKSLHLSECYQGSPVDTFILCWSYSSDTLSSGDESRERKRGEDDITHAKLQSNGGKVSVVRQRTRMRMKKKLWLVKKPQFCYHQQLLVVVP